MDVTNCAEHVHITSDVGIRYFEAATIAMAVSILKL